MNHRIGSHLEARAWSLAPLQSVTGYIEGGINRGVTLELGALVPWRVILWQRGQLRAVSQHSQQLRSGCICLVNGVWAGSQQCHL